MKRIGIISDTHGYWDDKYEYYLGECDEIWHAGDIGSLEVADKFEAMKPIFRAVCGNIDDYTMRNRYREILRFKCEDVDVLLKHIGGYPGRYDRSVQSMLYASPPNLFHINPGAAGLRGWHKERTLVRLTIEGDKFTDCEVITLGNKQQENK